ncbi:lectin-like sugar binding domain [Thermus phage P74-26]|uniref:Lectin-like sugar binding domain n=1 Tax=Thermus phage P74-26 TaxID=2914007 RepID=A7XXS7_BP742|nr:lectin-like sugar binding domain [Thermus phage P74-26]ABU97047.1 lectin-like sugar binding domain [Thermus phage P74-26]
MLLVKETVPNADLVVYREGFLYLKVGARWYVDPIQADPVELKPSFLPLRAVVIREGLVLLGEHGAAIVKGAAMEEYLDLERPWAPLGVVMDGNKTVSGVPHRLRDREDLWGLPLTRTKTWWVSGQFGLKGSFPVVGGLASEAKWVFGDKQMFVYWSGLKGTLHFGAPPEVGIPYTYTLPLVGSRDAYYFSGDGANWVMRRVEGWTFGTEKGLGLYQEGKVYALKGLV